jgi:TfoX/Sxy family transcriptional regulator of competence genes
MPGPLAVARQMFGYPAGFVNGNMFMGLFQESMIVRLAEPTREQLLKLDGAKDFGPMPGRPMKEYVAVPPAVIEDKEKLRFWTAKALEYGLSLKPKPAKSAGSAAAKKKKSVR